MKIRLFLILLLALCIVSPASAQSLFNVHDFLNGYQPSIQAAPPANPPSPAAQILQTGEVPIAITDVVNMTIDKNLNVRADRLAPRSSALEELVFYKVFEPTLTISGAGTRNVSPSTTQLNGATSLNQLQDNVSAGYSQFLPAGTTLGVTATMARLSSNSSLSTYNPSYTGQIKYSVSQHLLQNRGRVVNMKDIVEQENTEKSSESALELQLETLVVTVKKAYWNLVFTVQDLDVKRRALDLANTTLMEDNQKVEIGTLAKNDVLQTQLSVAQNTDAFVAAQGAQTTAEDQVKKLISGRTDPSLFLIKFRTLDAPREPGKDAIPSLEEAVNIAFENRPEMKQALLDLKNKDIDVEYTKNQKLPVLDVNAGFNQNGVGGTQTPSSLLLGTGQVGQVVPGGLGNAFDQLFSFGYPGYTAGFSLVIPLNNKAAKADFSRAVNERKISDANLDVVKGQVMLDVRNALTQVETTRHLIDTARISAQLARDTATNEQTKMELGTSISKNVADDQATAATAETAQLQAEINYTNALIDLDQAMGLTLSKNNIQLEKVLEPVKTGLKTN